MTYDIQKRKGFRSGLCTIVEIDLDINDPDLAAEFALDLNSMDTPKTTNDLRAYKAGAFRTYRYADCYIANLSCFPALKTANSKPPKVNPGVDIGTRFTADVSLSSFNTGDEFELQDLYSNRRVYGNHWAKLFRRNQIKNRPCRIKRGYLIDDLFYEENFLTEHYVIDNYSMPTIGGDVSFKFADVLVLTNEVNAKAPINSNCTLNEALAAGITTCTINAPEGATAGQIEDLFGPNGTTGVIAIASERMTFTVTSVTGVSPITMDLVRAQFGTTNVLHEINSSVQNCLFANNENVIDVLIKLFLNTQVPESYYDLLNWEDLKTGELAPYNLTNVISKPTEVKKLINQIIQIAGLTISTDVIEQKIKIVPNANYEEPIINFTIAEHYQHNTFKINNDFKRLTTRQFIRWGVVDYSDDSNDSNYSKTYLASDIYQETAANFGFVSEAEELKIRWLSNSSQGNQLATSIVQRNVLRFSLLPKEISFEVDTAYIRNLPNDKIFWLGSVFSAEIPLEYENLNGAIETVIAQCTSLSPVIGTDRWSVTGLVYNANIPANVDYTIEPGLYLDYDLAANFTFDEAREYIVVVSSGVVFGSTSTSTPAFYQGSFVAGATLKLIQQGQIAGKGGQGGAGASPEFDLISGCVGVIGGPGFDGGPGAEFTTDAVIDNSFGIIGGGGGGGQGGLGVCDGSDTYGGDGGGGGQGAENSLGGIAGTGTAENGLNGNFGTLAYPGAALNSFKGGELGQNGFGTLGGLAGAAIITNGFTVSIIAGNNAAKIKGVII